MAEINLAEEIVKNYSDKDIVAYIERNFRLGLMMLEKGVKDQHIGYCGQANQHFSNLYEVISAYQVKKNGKKGTTVL